MPFGHCRVTTACILSFTKPLAVIATLRESLRCSEDAAQYLSVLLDAYMAREYQRAS